MPAAVSSAARPSPPAPIPIDWLICALGRSTLVPAHQPHVSLLLLLWGAALRWCAFVVMARLHPLVARRRASIRYVRLTFCMVPLGFAVSHFLSGSSRPAHGWCCGPAGAGRVCLPLDGDRAELVLARARILWRDSCRHVAKNQCPLSGGACCVDACELLIRTHPAFSLHGLSGDPMDAAFPASGVWLLWPAHC